MYERMCVCESVCVPDWVFIIVCVCERMCVCARLGVHKSVCIYVCVYVCVCQIGCAYECVCMCVLFNMEMTCLLRNDYVIHG